MPAADAGWLAAQALGEHGRLGLALCRHKPATPTARRALLAQAAELGCTAPLQLGAVRWPRNSPPLASEPWQLAFAHSGAWTLAAATARPQTALGADLERCRPRRYERLERHLGWSGSASLAHFYRRWTLAESCFKAVRQPVASGHDAAAIFAALDSAANYRTSSGTLQQLALDTGLAELAWYAPTPGLLACTLLLAP